MTTQIDLSRVWGSTGASIDPGLANYLQGWIAEIPTFQEFNYVLKNLSTNILSNAEKGSYSWDVLISYAAGAKVDRSGVVYFCTVANIGEDPELDTLGNYWSLAETFGTAPDTNDGKRGQHLNLVDVSPIGTWSGSSQTITAARPTLALNTTGATDNMLVANVSGFLAAVNVGNVSVPDGKNVALGQPGVYKVFHEGNKPVQSDVAGTIPDVTSPAANTLYARTNSGWAQVSSTFVSTAPPPPSLGNGAGWYNLNDGVHYTDIDDGDSSQWVPSSPPRTILSASIPYDNASSGLAALTMQEAIDELAANH